MRIEIFDRLTRKKVDGLSGHEILPGRYQLLAVVDGKNKLTINSFPAHSGDFFVPNQHGTFLLTSDEGDKIFAGYFTNDFWPPDRERDSLFQFGRILTDVIESGGSWLDWIDVTPITPGISERARLLSFEESIDTNVKYLREICRRPITHLRIEDEREPISRARKVSTRAVQYLAGHTEDWQYKKVRSVVPKRILTEVAEEELNIYENQVTVRLIDHLSRYLKARLDELKKLESELDFVVFDKESSHWFQKRVAFLVAESLKAEKEKVLGSVGKTIKHLEKSYRKVSQLKDSRLYRTIPRQAKVAPQLRKTNIFANSDAYRHVSELWQEWLQQNQIDKISGEEYFANEQYIHKGFDYFSVLLILRSLKDLDFNPTNKNSAQIKPGVKIQFNNHHDDEGLYFTWNENGTITLELEGPNNAYSGLRFIPLLASLRTTTDFQLLEKIINKAISSKTDSWKDIILYSGELPQTEDLSVIDFRLHTLANDLPQFFAQQIGFLPISTYEFGSIERVARAIRWIVAGNKYLNYPIHLDAPKFYELELLREKRWLIKDSEGRIALIRTPDEREKKAWSKKIDKEIRRCMSHGAKQKREKLALEDLKGEIEKGINQLESLKYCPVCGNQNQSDMEVLDQNNFECICNACGSRWGTRVCGSCDNQFPFISVGGMNLTEKQTTQDWIDKKVGRDVLAIPCWIEPVGNNFICPECGHCTNDRSQKSKKCARCNFIHSFSIGGKNDS